MPRAKQPRRRNSWKPVLEAEQAAVVLTLKRGETPQVFAMEGDLELLSKILAAVSSSPAPRRRRSKTSV